VSTDHREGVAAALEGIAATLAGLRQLDRAARIWVAAQAVYEGLHGVEKGDNRVPFARLPQFSPHLNSIATQWLEPACQRAQAAGHAAPLEDVIAWVEALDSQHDEHK